MIKRGPYKKVDPEKRFWSKVYIPDAGMFGSNECWAWVGSTSYKGYGGFKLNGKMVKAHRYAYHLAYLDFPISGLSKKQLDHLCRNRACVNPAHLEIVSNRENAIRGRISQLNPKKSSKHTGIYWCAFYEKWHARIYQNGKSKHLGYFNSEEAAAEVYEEALKKL